MGNYFGRNARDIRKDTFKSNKEAAMLALGLAKSQKQEAIKENTVLIITPNTPPQKNNEDVSREKWFLSPDIQVHVTNEITEIFSSFSSGGPDF